MATCLTSYGMPQTLTEIMEKIQRLEDVVFGVPEDRQEGLLERVNRTESTAEELLTAAKKLIWVMVLGFLAAVGNLLLSSQRLAEAKNARITPPLPAAITTDHTTANK